MAKRRKEPKNGATDEREVEHRKGGRTNTNDERNQKDHSDER